MHQTRRSLGYVLLIILVAVLPTALMLSWYQYTRDPNLRPLGITREALRAYGVPGTGVELLVYVDWPAASLDRPARSQLARDLRASFASKGVDATLVFRGHSGPPQITYVIGSSVLGPYSIGRAAEGVTAAVEAYRMY